MKIGSIKIGLIKYEDICWRYITYSYDGNVDYNHEIRYGKFYICWHGKNMPLF